MQKEIKEFQLEINSPYEVLEKVLQTLMDGCYTSSNISELEEIFDQYPEHKNDLLNIRKQLIDMAQQYPDDKQNTVYFEQYQQLSQNIINYKFDKYRQVYKLDPDFVKELLKTDNLTIHADVLSKLKFDTFKLDISNISGLVKNNLFSALIISVYQDLWSYSINIYGENPNAALLIDVIKFFKNKPLKIEYNKFDYDCSMFIPSLSSLNTSFSIDTKDLFDIQTIRLLVLQFITYIMTQNPDIREEKEQKKLNQFFIRKNQSNYITNVHEVGVRFGRKIRLFKKENNIFDNETVSDIVKKRSSEKCPYVICAHYHYHWHGSEKDGSKKLVLHWHEPAFANVKKGNIDIVIHDTVKDDSPFFRGERTIKSYLDFHQYDYKKEYTIRSTHKRFDFCVMQNKKKVFIEFDGQQHFKPVDRFGGLEEYAKRKKSDDEKTKYCEKNGIPLLRIHYQQEPNINQILDLFFKNVDKYTKKHNPYLDNKQYYKNRK